MDMITLGAALKGAKAYTDATIAPLLGGVHYYGSVNYFNNLPQNPAEGDAYTVKYSGTSGTSPDGTEYVWGLDTDDNTYKWIGFSPDTYTKAEVDNLLSGKQATIDSSHKLSADLVDDSSSTNKFATAAQLQQIETNKTNISNIETSLSSTSSDAGKVLTADGEGGYAWQPASGGAKKYLYQINVLASLETVSPPINYYRLRLNLTLISDDANLLVPQINLATFEQKYLIFSGTSGYVQVCNISNITIAEGSLNQPFELVSYVRKNIATNRYYFQTSNNEYELKLTNGIITLTGAKTEI